MWEQSSEPPPTAAEEGQHLGRQTLSHKPWSSSGPRLLSPLGLPASVLHLGGQPAWSCLTAGLISLVFPALKRVKFQG